MAFTEAQKVQIRKFLGRPAFITDALLERALFDTEGLPEAQAEVEVILAKLGDIQARWDALHKTAVASGVGATQLDPDRYAKVEAAGQLLCGQLSKLMGVPLAGSPWSGGGAGANGRCFPLRWG